VDLDVRYRFENYIVGSANRLAVSAARAVAEAPGAAYNPLFIYSGSGLGKTHLMVAIGHLARQVHPELAVAYTTADEMVDQLTGAIATGALEGFKQRWQRVGMLLLDDVQFLAGRRETQAEMLRLFDALQRVGTQVVLTSDRPPAEIADLDERLITRLSGGLVVDVDAPDFETRVAILRLRCEERRASFASGVLEELAAIPFGNVRELQGALHRLIANQALDGGDASPATVRALFKEWIERMPASASQPKPASGALANAGEFASFLSDVSEAVAQHLESWRIRVVEAMTYWRHLGYTTTMLEQALGSFTEPDVDALLERYEAAIARLRALAQEAARADVNLAASEIFFDPERIAEAELVVARLAGDVEPPPGPLAEYTRADFEVGPSNQLALHAAETVIEAQDGKYNPVFLHGPTGVGKTHLLHAIGNELIALSGGSTIVACVSAGQFAEELIAALRDGAVERWRARYRLVDVLILDDAQELAGKERTQEELFHLFNSLYGTGRQIIIAADRAPRSLEGLEERLRSRFEGGLVVEVQPPDQVLREKLYARYLATAGVPFDRALVDYLSAHAVGSVAEIATTVHRLVHAAEVVRMPLTAAFARQEVEGEVARSTLPVVDGGTADALFLDHEKVIWDWPDSAGRMIEEFR
jgi:chromosomal replication initiator protein DnaA